MTTNKQTQSDDASLHPLFECVATVNQNTKKRLFVWTVPAWCLNDAFSIHHILGTYHSRTCQSFYEQFNLFVLFNCSSLGCHFYLFFYTPTTSISDALPLLLFNYWSFSRGTKTMIYVSFSLCPIIFSFKTTSSLYGLSWMCAHDIAFVSICQGVSLTYTCRFAFLSLNTLHFSVWNWQCLWTFETTADYLFCHTKWNQYWL